MTAGQAGRLSHEAWERIGVPRVPNRGYRSKRSVFSRHICSEETVRGGKHELSACVEHGSTGQPRAAVPT